MEVTIPKRQRQEFECYCYDNNIDPLSLRGLAVWEGWQAAYITNTPITISMSDLGKKLLGDDIFSPLR